MNDVFVRMSDVFRRMEDCRQPTIGIWCMESPLESTPVETVLSGGCDFRNIDALHCVMIGAF